LPAARHTAAAAVAFCLTPRRARLRQYRSRAILSQEPGRAVKPIFTAHPHSASLSVVGPASPAASPESES
jgi:hypothetical protein